MTREGLFDESSSRLLLLVVDQGKHVFEQGNDMMAFQNPTWGTNAQV